LYRADLVCNIKVLIGVNSIEESGRELLEGVDVQLDFGHLDREALCKSSSLIFECYDGRLDKELFNFVREKLYFSLGCEILV